MFSKLTVQLKRHKFASGIAVFLIIGLSYWSLGKLFSEDGVIRYATAEVQKGTLIVSISGTGQVSTSNQVDIKPKASGDLIGVYITQGQEVRAGSLIAQLDTRDAERSVRDAETALETAKLELEKMLEPLDELTLLQAENSLIQAKESKQKSEDNLIKTYEDGFNNVSNVFLALPNIMAGLQDMLYGSDQKLGGGSQWNVDYYAGSAGQTNDMAKQFKQDAYDKYQTARKAYDKNFADYKLTSRFSSQDEIDSLINQTYETVKLISESVKSANNLIQLYQDELTKRNLTPISLSNTHLSSLSSYTGTTNSQLVSLLSTQRSIKDSQESIVSAERTIRERELSFEKTTEGPDDLDIRSRKITIQQREDALATAKQNLADHYVYAPFAGVIAKVNSKKGDSASSGSALATLITKQKIAEITLNEIDVAQIEVSQKATLTFDAVPDLSLTGQVIELDTLGTASQGVVTYTVKIGFDTQDERVKTAMTVTAAIVTAVKPDILLISNSAVKSRGDINYVEIPDETDVSAAVANVSGAIFGNPIRQQQVDVGLSNDEFTEIIGGLNDGDLVITRTIQPNTAQTQTGVSQGGLRIPGLTGGGGGRGRGGSSGGFIPH